MVSKCTIRTNRNNEMKILSPFNIKDAQYILDFHVILSLLINLVNHLVPVLRFAILQYSV